MAIVQDEIRAAVAALQLPPNLFREPDTSEAETILANVRRRFVTAEEGLFWWENLASSTSQRIAGGDGWRLIAELVPDPNELVWFLAGIGSPDTVFETTPREAQAILGECSAFEYYLVDKELRWLLCENHHDFLVGCGDPIESRLKTRVC